MQFSNCFVLTSLSNYDLKKTFSQFFRKYPNLSPPTVLLLENSVFLFEPAYSPLPPTVASIKISNFALFFRIVFENSRFRFL